MPDQSSTTESLLTREQLLAATPEQLNETEGFMRDILFERMAGFVYRAERREFLIRAGFWLGGDGWWLFDYEETGRENHPELAARWKLTPEDCITVSQIAAMTDITPRAIKAMETRGDFPEHLPHARAGRTVTWDRVEVVEWMYRNDYPTKAKATN